MLIEPINKFQQFEKIAMYMVGFSMVLNLYMLVGLIVPSSLVIVLGIVVSFAFFILRFNKEDFVNQLINWNLFIYLSVSILFWGVAVLLKNSQPNFNDLIRITGAAFYFNWVMFSCKTYEKLKEFYLRFSAGLFLILILQAVVEYYFPVEFGILISPVSSKTSIKVATSLSDPNNFADFIIILSIVLLTLYSFKNRRQYRLSYFSLLVICFVLANISGSRQGLILWGFFLLGFIWGFIEEFDFKKLLYIGLAMALFISISIPVLKSYFQENQGSAVARLFLGGANSDESTNSRWATLEAGFEFVKSNYFVFGSGSINFDKAWFDLTNNDTPLPHNSFVFLYCQYGIFALALFYFFFKTLKRAFISKQYLIILGLLVPYFFQPNFVYYPISFFVISYIDTFYLKQLDKPINSLSNSA